MASLLSREAPFVFWKKFLRVTYIITVCRPCFYASFLGASVQLNAKVWRKNKEILLFFLFVTSLWNFLIIFAPKKDKRGAIPMVFNHFLL